MGKSPEQLYHQRRHTDIFPILHHGTGSGGKKREPYMGNLHPQTATMPVLRKERQIDPGCQGGGAAYRSGSCALQS